MYIIEMHHKSRAFSQIVFEKGDAYKTYLDLADFKVIINHAGDVDVTACRWCAMQRKDTARK